MLAELSLFELAVYVFAWACIGGLPGFYLFSALDRNPRVGARIGVVVGAVVGLAGAAIGLIDSAAALLNAVLVLWLLSFVAAAVLPMIGVEPGSYSRTASLGQRSADLAYGLLLPAFVLTTIIIVFPMIWNVFLAFRPVRLRDLQDFRLFSFDDLTFSNFERVFNTRGFGDTLMRTFIYTIAGTIVAILLGLVAALIVKDKFPGRNLVRGFMLFPYIAPIISVVLIWKMMFNAQYGLVNEIVDAFGGRRMDFLNTPGIAFTMVILFQGWRYFPFAFLFILARIQAIPDDMYEAAKVDGAAPSQRLWYVTLPQLRPVIGTLFLLRFIWTFNKFDDVFLLTGGAAQTKLVTIEVYDQLFGARNVGTAAAVAIILAVVLFILVAVYQRFFNVEEA